MATDVNMGEELADNQGGECLFEAVPDNSDQAGQVMMEGVVEIQETSTSAENHTPEEKPLSGSFTWTIPGWSTLGAEKLYSDKFEIGTYIWRLLVFPKGNKQDFLSVYLDAPEAAWTPAHMNPRATFRLVLHNHSDPTLSFHKEANHTFSAQETDWGFTQFMTLAEISDPRKGYVTADDKITLTVEITVQRDERDSYDSRKETGHVGLKNQGATCYMNSLLQYLFHLPYFRKAVYHMPTPENDEPSKSIPLALQSLFYKLQYSRTSVSTKDLTKSFGWSTYDAFLQHDVQELNRVLCEKLEEKMKGTRVEKVINEVFEGHTHNFIECVDVEYKSTRRESFMDLQLDVKGCANIYDSFDKYTAVEMMTGENQYKAEGYGLQDARKGVLFEDFPPVLQLQLKRFEYDFQRDTMVKINDRYEFYDTLDLDRGDGKYLAPSADRTLRNEYKLHSVLVHSGGVHGGHYYAFIRPDGKNWLKFDDDRVTLEEPHRALAEQFGGEEEGVPPPPAHGFGPQMPVAPGTGFKFTKHSNAYMLVYIRTQHWDQYMCNVTKEDIAPYLRERLEVEQREKERRQKEKMEAHLYCYVRLSRDEDFREQIGKDRWFDLVDYDKLTHSSFRIPKHTKFNDFKKMVEEKLGVPVSKQRYWVWQQRQNKTYRPSRRLKPEEEELCLMDLREHRETTLPASKHALMDLKLFLETPLPDASADLHKVNPRQEILLFFKYYDPATGSLSYCGRMYAPKQLQMQDLYGNLCRAANLPEGTDLECYEEIKFDPTVMIEQINPSSVLHATAQLEDGDIICFQRAVAQEEEAQYKHPHVNEFLTYIRNRKVVTFRKLEEPKEEGIRLELLRDMEYDTVAEALAAELKLEDPTKLRLTQHNAYSHQPQRNPLKYRQVNRLEAMLQHAGHAMDCLYYEVLDLPLPQLEQLKTLKINFHNEKTDFVDTHTIRLPRDSCVADVLEELRKRLGDEYADKKLRLMEVFNSKIYKVLDPADDISTMNETYWVMRAELVTEEETALSEGDRVVHVYHFITDKDNNTAAGSVTTFGDPFLLRIGAEEQMDSIKARIREKLGVQQPEFDKWKFAFVSIRAPPEYLSDEDVPAERFAKAAGYQTSESNYLGLEHEDKGPKRPSGYQRYNCERPVKIYN
eukprot:jgi/Chrzof1/13211/Cz07g24170.t1